MKFPDIPKHQNITLKQAILDLLNSVAEEEAALSNLINAEAQKTVAFTGERKNFPTMASNEEILQYCQSVNHIVDSIVMKEWLILKKLEAILQASQHFKRDGVEIPDWEDN